MTLNGEPRVYSGAVSDHDAAEFVRAMCAELRHIASRRGWAPLAYILDMARLEADERAHMAREDAPIPDAERRS